MISVILAAGYATRMVPLTENFPKPLLPIGETTILDRLIEDLDTITAIDRHVIVTNARYAARFEEWLAGRQFKKPVTILNDGSTAPENRLGAVRDLLFCVDSLGLDDDLLVLAGDNVLNFSLKSFYKYFKRMQTSCVMCYREEDPVKRRRSGILVPDDEFRVVDMVEKPENPPSHWAVPPFYILARRDLPEIARGLDRGMNEDAPGSMIAYLCHERPVYALPMPGKRFDVGDLKGYEALKAQFVDDPGAFSF